MPFSKDLLIGASGNQGGGGFYEYQIEQSCRFDKADSSSLKFDVIRLRSFQKLSVI